MNNPRKFSKGFVRNGHDVVRFSYRSMLLQNSPIASKKWAVRLAKKKVDRLLATVARDYQPDMVVFFIFKRIDAETVAQLKEAAPRAQYVSLYGDMYRGCDPKVTPIARQCDWFVATSGGLVLRDYKALGIPHCAFLPNPADPDVEGPRSVQPQWRSKLMFTGKLQHKLEGQDVERPDLIQSLADHKGMTVWGCLGRPSVQGRDYVDAICGADIGLSINVFNDVRLYHSERLTHYLSHGTFVLAKHVPDTELLFTDGEHLRYFRSNAECLELVDRYLADEPARRKIAAAGMNRVHTSFRCEEITRHLVDLVTIGQCTEPWAEIL